MKLTHKLVRDKIPERFPVDESRQIDELGDLLTVMQALASDSGVDWNRVLTRQSQKALEWGDFSELNYLVAIKPDYIA